MKHSFFATFILVFIVAFVANIATVFVWNLAFRDSPLQWDTTTAPAVIVGVVMAIILNKKRSQNVNK